MEQNQIQIMQPQLQMQQKLPRQSATIEQPQKLTSSTIIVTETDQRRQNCMKKVGQSVWNGKISFIVELFRIGVYLAVAFGVFYAFQRTSHISLHQQTYFSSEQVVYPSQIRGLFPPIQGSSSKLLGKWHISFTNSLQISNTDIYNNYTIQFKSNSILRIKHKGCDGDLLMNYLIFQYNIFISEPSIKDKDQDKEMYIQPNKNDSLCIRGEDGFVDYLMFASVWTFYQGNLYILVEKYEDVMPMATTTQSILLLEQGDH